MSLLRSFVLGIGMCAVLGVSTARAAELDQPSLSVVDASRASITLQIQTGPSGAPAGFLVEWMSRAAYNGLGGWPSDPYYSGLYFCEFTGVPTYNTQLGTTSFIVGPNGAAQFEMGDIFDETGLYANYDSELAEGADFVFRARAVGTGAQDESMSSATLFASTSPRLPTTDCTLTQGFWKNHPQSWSNVVSITLGTVSYTQAQLLQIFGQPAQGNGLVSLAHQLIAAKLNILLGATAPPSVASAIASADALIGNKVVPPIGAGYIAPGTSSPLTSALDNFNNGKTGPGHCPDGGVTPARNTTWGRIKTLYR